jgi:hypothetical protein
MIAPSLAPTTAGKGPIGETGLIAGLLAKVRASLDLQMMEPTFERIFGGKNAMRLTSASAVTSAVEKVRVRLELD